MALGRKKYGGAMTDKALAEYLTSIGAGSSTTASPFAKAGEVTYVTPSQMTLIGYRVKGGKTQLDLICQCG